MTVDDREILKAICEVQARDRVAYLSIIFMLTFLTSEQGGTTAALRQELQCATRSELKRAIKRMRQVQSAYKHPEDIDGAVSLIRKEYLQK